MLFSLLGILIPFLILGPVMIFEVNSKILNQEKAQIGVDNAAITIGKEHIKIWNGVTQVNEELETLEKAHHLTHWVTKIPGGLLTPIGVEDIAVEVLIEALILNAEVEAQLKWTESFSLAEREADKMGSKKHEIIYRRRVPVHSVRCSVCNLKSRFEIDLKQARVGIMSSQSNVGSLQVITLPKSLVGNSSWTYKIREVN